MFASRSLMSLVFVCLAASYASAADFGSQEKVSEPRQSALMPILVCPPRYSTPILMPAEELLREAEQVQPVTPEGWIVRNRPVQDCVNYIGDAAQRSYELFEHPIKLRHYDSQIRLLQAEVCSLQRRLANYQYFNKAGGLFITVENTRLALFAVQEQLRNLRYERMLFVRLHSLERQLSQGVPVDQPVISDTDKP